MFTQISLVQSLCYIVKFYSYTYIVIERIRQGTTKQYRDDYKKLIWDDCIDN